MKKYSVVSIHYTTNCDLNCSFCYKTRVDKKLEKPRKFWFDLVPYIKKISNQIALGGGEPFLDTKFIIKLGNICKKNKVILNVTTNGKKLVTLSDIELKKVLKNITMVSISYDREKIKLFKDAQNYKLLIDKIKANTKTRVGCNLLIDESMFDKKGSFVNTVKFIFSMGVDRIFALYPKNQKRLNILKHIKEYIYLTDTYEHFYVDDLSKMILEEKKYSNWKNPCHYGKDIISINEQGFITGCSFDSSDEALLMLTKPKDILKITKIKIKKRFACPYI